MNPKIQKLRSELEKNSEKIVYIIGKFYVFVLCITTLLGS